MTASILQMRKWRLRDSLFHLWEVTGQDVNSRLSGHLLSNAPLKLSATLSAGYTGSMVSHRTQRLSQELVPKLLCLLW